LIALRAYRFHGSDQAVDVTGAGDTVLAAYTLALACSSSPLEAAHIANIAGGLVVMKRGTATVSRAELLEAIRRDAGGFRRVTMRSAESKIVTPERLRGLLVETSP